MKWSSVLWECSAGFPPPHEYAIGSGSAAGFQRAGMRLGGRQRQGLHANERGPGTAAGAGAARRHCSARGPSGAGPGGSMPAGGQTRGRRDGAGAGPGRGRRWPPCPEDGGLVPPRGPGARSGWVPSGAWPPVAAGSGDARGGGAVKRGGCPATLGAGPCLQALCQNLRSWEELEDKGGCQWAPRWPLVGKWRWQRFSKPRWFSVVLLVTAQRHPEGFSFPLLEGRVPLWLSVVVVFSLLLHKISWPRSQDRKGQKNVLSLAPKITNCMLSYPPLPPVCLSICRELGQVYGLCPELDYLDYCSTMLTSLNQILL